jgi:hemolysin activation/secretion protein
MIRTRVADRGALFLRVFLCAAGCCAISVPARAQEQADGASTFDSATHLYREEKRDWQAEDVVVPAVEVLPDVAAKADDDSGPKFRISRFDIVGDTLLGLAEIDRVLAPFALEQASFATVEKARNALQERYEDAGFLTVAVAIPPQNVDGGVVQLNVVEARLGDVAIENEGRHWVSDERIAALVPELRPGALLEREKLQSDLSRANAERDFKVKPVLGAGKQPGTVDLRLVVEDRLPIHGSFEYNNQQTAGSPPRRGSARIAYSDLWGLGHEISVSHVTAPGENMEDMRVLAASYALPSPFREKDRITFSYADSDSENPVAGTTLPGLMTLGRGQTYSLRYDFALPPWDNEEQTRFLFHGLAATLDVKEQESRVTRRGEINAETGKVEGAVDSFTPIAYRPLSIQYWLQYVTRHSVTSASITGKLNRADTLGGDSADGFNQSRKNPRGGGPIATGDYEVLAWELGHTLRGSSLLQSLAAGRWIWDDRAAGTPLTQDWNVVLRTFGQLTSEALIPGEQMPGGGVRTVRGYFEAELFGDEAIGMQLEVVSRAFPIALAGYTLGATRLLFFYDDMSFRNLAPGKEAARWRRLYSTGFGVRTEWGPRLTSEFVFGYPLFDGDHTSSGAERVHFFLRYGF